jgi:chemotaxis-related protein WspD
VTRLSSAAAELLDRELTDDYRREWTEVISAKPRTLETDFKSIVIFRIGPEWLALPTSVVKQIAERTPIHSLPHRSGGVVRGIVGIRGDVFVCVALDALLGVPRPVNQPSSTSSAARERIVLCDAHGGQLAFAADEVYGVDRYFSPSLRAVPATVSRATSTYTLGILPWKDSQTVGCLDAELVFYALSKGLA